MVATAQSFLVRNEAEFDCLPEDGIFEVVDGRAILLPANDVWHQKLSFALAQAFDGQLRRLRCGFMSQQVNVFTPPARPYLGEVQNRVPDLVIASHEPKKRYEIGNPPELVIEILSTRRGNVERTEKMDDYARAGIGEYWIVDPFDRAIEVYVLAGADYVVAEATVIIRPRAFPGVEIDPREIWGVLGES